MHLKPWYNFLSFSALSNIPYHNKKVKDEGGREKQECFILMFLFDMVLKEANQQTTSRQKSK